MVEPADATQRIAGLAGAGLNPETRNPKPYIPSTIIIEP